MPSLTPRPAIGAFLSGSTDGYVLIVGAGGVIAQVAAIPIDAVSGLQAALDNKASAATVAAHVASTSNPHAVTAAQVGAYTTSQVDTALAGKAAASHSHAISDVASLQDALDAKADSSGLGTIATLSPSGTADDSTFLRGDGAWATPTATATPGGSSSQVQFNNAGSLDGASHLVWDEATARLKVGDHFASPYTTSIQTNTDQTWLEILNNGGTNRGAFFGVYFDNFELYNWQGGGIHFFTHTSPSGGTRRGGFDNDGTFWIIYDGGSATSLLEFRNSVGTPVSLFRTDGSWKPPSLADSGAANDSVYYSTTQSKLVYKDPSGVANPLF